MLATRLQKFAQSKKGLKKQERLTRFSWENIKQLIQLIDIRSVTLISYKGMS